jgi:hypothetical protein
LVGWLFPLPASYNPNPLDSKLNTEGSRLDSGVKWKVVFRFLVWFGCFGLELSRGFTDETPVIKDPRSTPEKNSKKIWNRNELSHPKRGVPTRTASGGQFPRSRFYVNLPTRVSPPRG